MNGEIVVIVSAKLNALTKLVKTGDLPQNVNYAIKVQFLKALLDSVPKKGEVAGIKEILAESGSLEVLAGRVQGSVLRIEAN